MVEREYQPQCQKVLRWSQPEHAWLYLGASKEPSVGSSRIVPAVLQPQNGVGFLVRDSIFERGRDRFDGLPG